MSAPHHVRPEADLRMEVATTMATNRRSSVTRSTDEIRPDILEKYVSLFGSEAVKGLSIDLGMAMGALNTGAASWMWDWEDAAGDYKEQLYQAWQNLADILAHKWDDKPFSHPKKLELDKQGKPIPGRLRKYTIDLP